MRPIDADALLSDRMKTKFYHLPNGDVAIPLIDVEHAPTIGGWISVKDRLPEVDKDVLVFAVGKIDGFIMETAIEKTFMHGKSLVNHKITVDPYWIPPYQFFLTDYEITHWMPLPEPPKEVERK